MSKKTTITYKVLRSATLPSGRVVKCGDIVEHKLFPEEGKVRVQAIRDMGNVIELVICPEDEDAGFRCSTFRGKNSMRGTLYYFF